MSLVGPRPALPNEAERYGRSTARRLLVKPGITGLWQVSGRSDLSWEDSVRLDLYYVENWSFAGDIQILWKTVSRRRAQPRSLLTGRTVAQSRILGRVTAGPPDPARARGTRR